MYVIAVTGLKGGVAKTVTAVHVATFLSSKGKTLLIDCDKNRSSLQWASQGKLPFEVTDETGSIKAIPGKDYVVIDTPASPSSGDLQRIAEGADLLILPSIPDALSLQPLIATIRELPEKANYRVLLTIIPPPPSKEAQVVQKELNESGIKTFKTMIRRSVGFSKSALQGIPISELRDRSRVAWNDYVGAGQEVLEIIKK